jgi:hypothetical protein
VPLQTSTTPKTPTVSPTPVIAAALSSPVATVTTDPATLAAMQTQLAYQMTTTAMAPLATSGLATQMPRTGFFEDFGLPSMIILALALVAVIFLARRMRRTPS